ncbi:MAG: deoxyribonuclease IV [Fibrobacterota bacterium]
MKYIGAHVSAAGGAHNAPKRAAKIGATGFALFTKNQRQWTAKPLSNDDIQRFQAAMKKYGYQKEQVLPHDSYLINLCNPDTAKQRKSLNAFIDELRRCEQLGLDRLNMHPGSHLNKNSEEKALDLIARAINTALAETSTATVVLENTAGQGTNLGYRLEHLARIMDTVADPARMGICIDTCHTFSAGYPIDTREGADAFFGDLDRLIGLQYLRGIHLNDSRVPFASRRDRHESIGKGSLGTGIFRSIASDSRFDRIPLILETPDRERWAEEISLLKSYAGTND